MTVNITISNQSGGDIPAEVVDLGNINPGFASDAYDLYIRHDALNFPITDCGFYVVRYVGSNYNGGEDPDTDYVEAIAWGDVSGAGAHGVIIDGDPTHGGFYLNQDHSTFSDNEWYVFRTGDGSDPSYIRELLASAINIGTPVAGEIQVDGEAHVQVRWDIPNPLPSGSSAGTRLVQLVMAYSYTS